jgi:predicted DNA-binding protein
MLGNGIVHMVVHMKTITINVSEPVYRAFQARARRTDRTASELIRQAMEEYLRNERGDSRSVLSFPPLDLGRLKKGLSAKDDLLAEMGHDVRR